MHLEKGPSFSIKLEKLEADLTSDLLTNGSWKSKKFKPYNFEALGAAIQIGSLHPLLKVRHEFRKIFLEMGQVTISNNLYCFNIKFHTWFNCIQKFSDWTNYIFLYFCFRFTEMPTNNFVENSFWNFDALFQPQQHPARDAHDTFFISGKFLY